MRARSARRLSVLPARTQLSSVERSSGVKVRVVGYLLMPHHDIERVSLQLSTSTAYLRSNQLRLYFSSMAYVLLQMLRRLGLAGTEFAKAQCATIRLKLLKIGALIRITVRKVWVSLAGGYPYVGLFRQIHAQLTALPLHS